MVKVTRDRLVPVVEVDRGFQPEMGVLVLLPNALSLGVVSGIRSLAGPASNYRARYQHVTLSMLARASPSPPEPPGHRDLCPPAGTAPASPQRGT